eukprot:3741301-Prymnesium_polylepis.1
MTTPPVQTLVFGSYWCVVPSLKLSDRCRWCWSLGSSSRQPLAGKGDSARSWARPCCCCLAWHA